MRMRMTALVVLAIDAALIAANWYAAPGRTAAWGIALVLVVAMTMALRRRTSTPSGTHGANQIVRGVATAGLVLLISLGGALAGAHGVAGVNVFWRATMAGMGVFLAVTGNALPKALTPLAAMRCDPARVQAFHRLAGWTWVLGGLTIAVAWVAFPIAIAERLTFILLPLCIVVVGAQAVWLHRTRTTEVWR